MSALLSILGDLERFTADLYPYRYVISPLLVAVAIGVVILGVKRGAHLYLWQHRLATGLIGTPALIIVLFLGNYLLSPLWERSFLEEDSPLAVVASTPAGVEGESTSATIPSNTPVQAGVTHRGEFEGADSFHFGRGQALIIETEDGARVLRFENFSVLNGPDLFVYLSEDPSGMSVTEELNLGELKATDGAFNYELPDDIDLASIRSAVVWCRRFGVLFAVAEFSLGSQP